MMNIINTSAVLTNSFRATLKEIKFDKTRITYHRAIVLNQFYKLKELTNRK